MLRRLGFVTDRPALAMQGSDGVIVEVFEWAAGAIALAHENTEMQALWVKFDHVCEYVPLNQLSEASEMFAQFKPIEL